MIYGYCRVSTRHQNLKRQIDALLSYGVKRENIFIDQMTGKTLERDGLKSLKTVLNSGDTLVIKEIDRLGRNRNQTTLLIKEFIENNVEVVVLDMPYLKDFVIEEIKRNKGFMEIMATTLLAMILEISEQERNKIIVRTKEGRDKALEAGIKFGRKEKISKKKFLYHYKEMIEYNGKPIDLQKKLGICKQTYYNYKRKYTKGEIAYDKSKQ